jgi:hypothetical protein
MKMREFNLYSLLPVFIAVTSATSGRRVLLPLGAISGVYENQDGLTEILFWRTINGIGTKFVVTETVDVFYANANSVMAEAFSFLGGVAGMTAGAGIVGGRAAAVNQDQPSLPLAAAGKHRNAI